MRYNHRIEFEEREEITRYNPQLGRREVVQKAELKTVPCHLSPLSVERSMQLFGDYKQTYLIARCKNRVHSKQSVVHIEGLKYKVIRTQQFRNRTDFYLELIV